MTLHELDAHFVKDISPSETRFVTSIDEADGLLFLCPVCAAQERGAHYVLCWKGFIPQDRAPTGGRWTLNGTGLQDVTISPSVQLPGPCHAHFWVRDGRIVLA